MSENNLNLKTKAKTIQSNSNSNLSFYKIKRKKQTECNCICCKKCNLYWKPLKKENLNQIIFPQKTIKFKKDFHCFKDCNFCIKYIARKEEQWKEYMATSGFEFDPITKQPKVNDMIIDIDKDNKDTIIKKIKEINKKEFQPVKTLEDGNCMTRSILRSIGENEENHLELRQILIDYVQNTKYENEREIFNGENYSSKMEYVKNARKDGFYLSEFVLETMAKTTNLIIGIYKNDIRYKNEPWNVIIPKVEKIKGIVLLYLTKEDSDDTENYQSIKLFNKHNLGNVTMEIFRDKNLNAENVNVNMKDKFSLNTLIVNTRSINDYLKRVLLMDILRSKEIDIAFLQETFLLKKDSLYFEGYKIYRDDNEVQRRKGVAILVSTKLDIECQRIASDPNGRFVKVRIKNRNDNNNITISNIYLEPNGELDDINKTIFDSDIIAGDMNNANSELNKTDVFHLKNIEVTEVVKLDNNTLFDHPILLGKIKYETNILNEETSIKILDIKKTEQNYKILNDITNGKDNSNQLIEPHKIIKVNGYEELVDIKKFGEEYVKMKKEIKEKNKDEMKIKYKNINSIVTQNKMNIENWYYINKTLIQKRNSKIWKTTASKYEIIDDYKKMFGHQENRVFNINKIIYNIDTIIKLMENRISILPKGFLYTPKSNAKDYNGFTQKFLINAIKDNEPSITFKKLRYLLNKITQNGGIEHFIHKNIKTILIKKKENADSQKDLRPISILPAWLITLEKITKPIINKIINDKITKSQFGFKEKSDCNLAKTMIYFKSQKYKYKKALLIDVSKAYDSVDRIKLKEIIKNKFNNEEALLLISFIELYEQLTMIIIDCEINATKGLPQGSALSPLYFNLYINDALNKLNEIKDMSAQAYADDLILQSKEINILQKGYEKTIELYNELGLNINSDKCELISDIKDDIIKDINQDIIITAKNEAKYLGQFINSEGIPTSDINKIQFGRLMKIISKVGELTRIAKIRIFITYLKSKINHLIPLIAITGGIDELWKTIRKIIFNTLLEHSTLPRESASAFGLGYYDIIVRPVLRLKERNFEYTNNVEEDEMMEQALNKIYKT